MKILDYNEENQIKELLLYRKVVRVFEDTLILDNGIELKIMPNEGCGGCSSGWYDIKELNVCDNLITNIEFVCEEAGSYDAYSYQIFVYAENQRLKLIQVDGDDGNGYYGTGYKIMIRY